MGELGRNVFFYPLLHAWQAAHRMRASDTRSVTVHAYVPSNGICRGFAFKYGKFPLPPRFLTALSVPKVPTREQ